VPTPAAPKIWGDLEDEVKLPPGIQRLSSIERRLFFEQLKLNSQKGKYAI
jgi:hypothetical protein